MPHLPSCKNVGNVTIQSQRLETNQKIKFLQILSHKEELKLVVGEKCIEGGFQWKTTKLTEERFKVVFLRKNDLV